MHRLDGHIKDIEPRILAICKHAPEQEEASLQQSLSAYGWVLLDSWVAWRTLRYLLKSTFIEENVDEKWFSTPSSYTASQLKAVWGIEEKTTTYIKTRTNKSFRELIDNTIQKKRNAAAHFTKKMGINGNDYNDIKLYFDILSKVFLLYETGAFIEDMSKILESKGYGGFRIIYPDGEIIDLDENIKKTFVNSIETYFKYSSFIFVFEAEQKKCSISFNRDGCEVEIKDSEGKTVNKTFILDDNRKEYIFFENKGYYLDICQFVSKVMSALVAATSNGNY